MVFEVILATTPTGIARASRDAGWAAGHVLSGSHIHCLAADKLEPTSVYAGTQEGEILRSRDRGVTWEQVGAIPGRPIRALAASPHEPGLLYAGARPAAMFRSRDGGASWEELTGFRKIRGRRLWFSPAGKPFTAYVHGLALSPTDPEVVVAGIEYGAIVRSTDGGENWSKHRPGALRDCHDLCFHATDGTRAYEGGYSGGATSHDAGLSWSRSREGMDRKYGWAVAADPGRPDVWYVAVAPGPRQAHGPGSAEAFVFRKVGDAPWEKLGGGLPQPLDSMPYTLATHRDAPGTVLAGLGSGDVWGTEDLGATWAKAPVTMPANTRMLAVA